MVHFFFLTVTDLLTDVSEEEKNDLFGEGGYVSNFHTGSFTCESAIKPLPPRHPPTQSATIASAKASSAFPRVLPVRPTDSSYPAEKLMQDSRDEIGLKQLPVGVRLEPNPQLLRPRENTGPLFFFLLRPPTPLPILLL